jgi:5-methyltetrahydropteroyltriglutamate--homocysteine methyltransferase
MYKTTIAGSLPKPGWLAESEILWAPWRLEGEDLERGKRDAALMPVRNIAPNKILPSTLT